MNEFCLKEKAITKGCVEEVSTGDWAMILGKYSNSQFATRIRVTDTYAINPKTGDLSFYDKVISEDDTERIVYKNDKENNNVALTLISIKNKTKQLLEDVSVDFFEFWCRINATGNRPIFLLFGYIIYGDMCFLQQISAAGTKVVKHFCINCEYHGDDNMFNIVHGQCNYEDDD